MTPPFNQKRIDDLLSSYGRDAMDSALAQKMLQEPIEFGATTNHIDKLDMAVSGLNLLTPVDEYLLSECSSLWQPNVSSSQESYRQCVSPLMKDFSTFFNAASRNRLYNRAVTNQDFLLRGALHFVDPLFSKRIDHYPLEELSLCKKEPHS